MPEQQKSYIQQSLMSVDTSKLAPEKKEAVTSSPDGKQQLVRMKRSIDQRAIARGQQERLKEAREKGETIVWSRVGLSLGVDTLSAKERESLPKLRKDFKYRAIGGVDMTTFDPEAKRDAAWFLKKSRWAYDFADLWSDGQIVSNFKRYNREPNVLLAIDDLARVSILQKQGRFDADAFKKDLDAKYGKEFLYGAEGIFNMLTALNRAQESVQGQDPGAVLYDLRIGQGRLQKAERFIELREMGLVVGANTPTQKPVGVSPVDESRKKVEEDLKWVDYNNLIDEYDRERTQLLGDVDKAEREKQFPRVEADRFRSELLILDMRHIATKEPSSSDMDRMTQIGVTFAAVREALSKKVEVTVSAPSVSAPHETTSTTAGAPSATPEAQEARRNIEKILNEGRGALKATYEWPENLDSLAEEIAREIVKTIDPNTGKPETFVVHLKGVIRARLTEAKKDVANTVYTLDQKTKIEFVEIILKMMKMANIERRPR